jgi:hypothetical protein
MKRDQKQFGIKHVGAQAMLAIHARDEERLSVQQRGGASGGLRRSPEPGNTTAARQSKRLNERSILARASLNALHCNWQAPTPDLTLAEERRETANLKRLDLQNG